MNAKQVQVLTAIGADVSGALHRMGGSEAVYEICLKSLQRDTTIQAMNDAIERAAWQDAFSAAHTLKGMIGNMGFAPLMEDVCRLVELLRADQTAEITEPTAQVNRRYEAMLTAIDEYFDSAT
jgi:chemotaxis protein histidine kinase CheA